MFLGGRGGACVVVIVVLGECLWCRREAPLAAAPRISTIVATILLCVPCRVLVGTAYVSTTMDCHWADGVVVEGTDGAWVRGR